MATERYEGARDIVTALLNARSRREVIFVRNATEGINLVAYAYGGKFLGPGDAIVSTEMEHHSNLVPWQELARRTGAELHFVRLTDRGELDPSRSRRSPARRTSSSSPPRTSRTRSARVNDVAGIARWAHEHGAVMVCDGAQAAPHRPVDVQALGCDFYAISGHKMCGPGIGALWGRERPARGDGPVPDRRRPDRQGDARGHDLERAPVQVRARACRRWPRRSGSARRSTTSPASGSRRSTSTSRCSPPTAGSSSRAIPGVTLYGPPPPDRAGILSFTVDGVHAHDVAQILDSEGVCVRAGHHCTQPAMRHFDVVATTRASLYLYNTTDDLDRLAAGLDRVKRTFQV